MKKIKNILKKILPRKVKLALKVFRIYCLKKFKAVQHDGFGFLILTPQHCNLGDHAIALSELFLFKQQNHNVVEITGQELFILLNSTSLLKNLIKDKPIFINGGGNLGTLWFNGAELPMRKIIALFPNNLKIIFPNTAFYDDSDFGKKELAISEELYNADKHLIIMAREKRTYEFLKKHYANIRSYLMPDMVLYLKPDIQKYKRHGAMTLFRSDHEKTMDDSERELIIKYLKIKLKDVEISDMNSEEATILPKQREKALNEKFAQLSSKKLVATDRLHGMIFCAITGTPCIVLNSKSPKVKGVYDWLLKDFPYILFMDSFDEHKAENFMSKICDKNFEYDNSYLQPYYEKLLSIINGVENFE